MNVGDDLADTELGFPAGAGRHVGVVGDVEPDVDGPVFPGDCSAYVWKKVILVKLSPMPAKDAYHHVVRTALEKESWQITHDPLRLVLGRRKGYVDLAAEKLLAAERGTRKIAVEIKSFLGASTLDEFEDALGQFLIYKVALETDEPDRQLYLAVPVSVYTDFFDDSFFVGILKRYAVRLLIFDENQQTIVQWID